MHLTDTSELKNIHKGRRGVVMGAGWSLTETDLSMFKDDVVFACNIATTAINRCSYFCMSDGADPESNFFEHGCTISDKILFFGEGLFTAPGMLKLWDKIKDKSLFLGRRWKKNLVDYDFNFDLEDGKVIWAADVGQIMAHMAHLTGCDPIILAGIDLNYKKNKKYCDSTIGPIVWSEKQGYGNNIFHSHLPDGADDDALSNSFEAWKQIKTANPNIQFLVANPQSRIAPMFKPFKQ